MVPYSLPYLATAYAEIGQLDEARRCITEATTAIETTNERWSEAEIDRMAGEIALKWSEPDVAKAQGYFERALDVARQQQAKSRELHAAMSGRASGATRASGRRLASYSLQSTAGSRKGLIRAIEQDRSDCRSVPRYGNVRL
jgi:hypothetical protein